MKSAAALFAFLMSICSALAPNAAHAELLTFNAANPASNDAARDEWLSAIGATPEHFVDFESGFIDNQNVHDVTGLFPGDLVIRDTSTGMATICCSAGETIGGSRPVGNFSVSHNERPFLELDFSAAPVDYVAFQDIDQAGTTGVVTFVGGATEEISFETTGTGGDSAEFVGIFRNDMPRISKLELDASGDGRWGIDNLEYGLGAATCDTLGGDSDADGVCEDGDGSGTPGDMPCSDGQTEGCDDNCPFWPNADQGDNDMSGIGNECECGDQTGDGFVDVNDILAINAAIFDPSQVTDLCDTNDDQLCDVQDILGANAKIFGAEAYCSRYPAPAP